MLSIFVPMCQPFPCVIFVNHGWGANPSCSVCIWTLISCPFIISLFPPALICCVKVHSNRVLGWHSSILSKVTVAWNQSPCLELLRGWSLGLLSLGKWDRSWQSAGHEWTVMNTSNDRCLCQVEPLGLAEGASTLCTRPSLLYGAEVCVLCMEFLGCKLL